MTSKTATLYSLWDRKYRGNDAVAATVRTTTSHSSQTWQHTQGIWGWYTHGLKCCSGIYAGKCCNTTCHFLMVKSRIFKWKLTFNVRIIEFPKSVKLWPKLVSKCFSIEQRIAFENGFAFKIFISTRDRNKFMHQISLQKTSIKKLKSVMWPEHVTCHTMVRNTDDVIWMTHVRISCKSFLVKQFF